MAERAEKARFLHVVSRSVHPLYPPRFPVPDELVPFETPWPEYSPVEHTDASVFANDRTIKPNGWADPADVSNVLQEEWDRRTESGALRFDKEGRPCNPCGRSGMVGRGLLGKWGPNYSADPLVTRWNPDNPEHLQMVAIRRRDTGDWAIPGGMVDAGEHVSVTVKREFSEEAGNISNPDDKETFSRLSKELFEGGTIVYKGYVDEARNTDNAWIETTVFHYHCGAELGRLLPLEAGDDAAAVRWFDITTEIASLQLYPPHRAWVGELASRLVGARKGKVSAPASLVSYVLCPSLTESMLQLSFSNLDSLKRGYLTSEQLAAIYSDPRGAKLYTGEQAQEQAQQVIAYFGKEGKDQLTFQEFVRWWEAATIEVPLSPWVSMESSRFFLLPSLEECGRVANEVSGVARLLVSHDESRRRAKISSVSGAEELVMELEPHCLGTIVYMTKFGFPLLTLWKEDGARGFSVYASRGEVRSDGRCTSPLVYKCEGEDAEGNAKLIDSRDRVIATIANNSSSCTIDVEPQFDASVLIGVLIASNMLASK